MSIASGNSSSRSSHKNHHSGEISGPVVAVANEDANNRYGQQTPPLSSSPSSSISTSPIVNSDSVIAVGLAVVVIVLITLVVGMYVYCRDATGGGGGGGGMSGGATGAGRGRSRHYRHEGRSSGFMDTTSGDNPRSSSSNEVSTLISYLKSILFFNIIESWHIWVDFFPFG